MARIIEFDEEDLEWMASEYEEGASLAFLAEEFDVSTTTIRNNLAAMGVSIRGRGRPRTVEV